MRQALFVRFLWGQWLIRWVKETLDRLGKTKSRRKLQKFYLRQNQQIDEFVSADRLLRGEALSAADQAEAGDECIGGGVLDCC